MMTQVYSLGLTYSLWHSLSCLKALSVFFFLLSKTTPMKEKVCQRRRAPARLFYLFFHPAHVEFLPDVEEERRDGHYGLGLLFFLIEKKEKE